MTNSIAIFCGSALGSDQIFSETARQVGHAIAEQGKTLVYGGGRSGLMGIVADSALEAGGQVIGVIPHVLVDRELAHQGLTELHVVKDMQERKLKMSALSDGFIAMPGGAGTLEEIDYKDPTWILLGLLEAKLDELADILEDIHKDLEKYSTEVLNNRHREMILDLDDMITRLAHLEDMLGKAQLCLIDLRRVLTFLSRPRALGSHIYDADIRELSEDVRSLVEHDAFLFQKVRFLLDTTSGFINTEQNDTIRRFSILPSMLAPPMLIASIYGMNTDVLPFAKGGTSFIVVSLILMAFLIGPLIYFRWKKWI
jgi:uncharacterized protein (TIGR00730 family)